MYLIYKFPYPNKIALISLKKHIDNTLEIPDRMIAILVGFLEQNNGKLSNRAKSKEFSLLTDQEVNEIETIYKEIFDLDS